MKPLVYYCRWQGLTLRLRGRGKTAVWGELVAKDETESTQVFRFDLNEWKLTLMENNTERVLQLDEMGTVIG
jgi:hypothetical protein